MSLDLYNRAALGCRTIANVLKTLAVYLQQSAPHHTTIRQWVIRNGCYNLELPLEKADDWVAIGDLTTSVGKTKCLAILGVRMSTIKNKEEGWTLTHGDVKVLGLHPTEKSDGTFVSKALEEAADRVGGVLAGVITDQGPDVVKGAKIFQKNHSETKVIYDIPHKLALVMKRAMKGDKKWDAYEQEIGKTRRLVHQTELAALMPAKPRIKARFMDIGESIRWGLKILEAKENGCLDHIPEDRYTEYFGWVDRYAAALNEWEFMIDAADMIKGTVREHGLSYEIYTYLIDFFDEMPIKEERLTEFVGEALEAVSEEVQKLGDDELIASTEVLESVFGKFKAINEENHGTTGNVLGIAAIVGSERTEEEVKKMLESCSVAKGWQWVKEKIGTSIAGARRQISMAIKGTRFNMCEEGAQVA
jgi:hypothetical protein